MRRVLVTGGGSGIGRSVAQHFAENGDAVTIAGRRMDALEETAKGRQMSCVTCDVTSEDQVIAMFDKSYDVVIANAGMGKPARLIDMSLDDWNHTIAVNLTGTFLTFREALKQMKPGGRLIAMASVASLKGNAMVPAYVAAKHGILGLVRSIAQDVAAKGITCNAICPGFTKTEMAETAISGLVKAKGLSKEKATQILVAGNPSGRLITTDEVAATAMFLASEGAASINGHALSISGGEI